MVKGFHHVGVATRNLSRLVDFYVEHFHGNPIREFTWDRDNTDLSIRLGLVESAGRLVFVGFPKGGLEIFQFEFPDISNASGLRSVARPGLSHFCFEVDDCGAEYARLSRAGMAFHAKPLMMPAGGVFAYGRDPDGNVVELLQCPPC